MLALRESISIVQESKAPSKGHGKSEIKDAGREMIPSNAGDGLHRKSIQRRTLLAWSASALTGLISFNAGGFSAPVRAALLTLLFPGAGYIACGNILGYALLLLTYMLLPLCLFAWFGAGGSLFPAALWILSAVGAYLAADTTVFESAGITTAVLLAAFFVFFNRSSSKARRKAVEKRHTRNTYLPQAIEAIDSSALPAPRDDDRELELSELRRVQYTIDQGLRDINDWTDHNIIDQFQTSALRYQLYEMMYCLGAYQGIYCPNFHGYASQALRNTIEKSLTPKVLGFWKWETLWGKFKTDYEPVDKDNIMVTGFILQGVMLYTANTGDLRYTKPKSLKFRVTDKDVYEHDVHSISRAIMQQWTTDPYTLFSCEPNWIYTPCNLQGMTGQVLYDRYFQLDGTKNLLPLFEESLTTNFMEPDGSILPIRSELTGFTIPGLCGALTDLVNALLCRGHLDNIARRMWAIFRSECVSYDEATGKLELKGLVGADKIDPGNYTASEYAIFPILAYVAGEYGDEKVRKAALEHYDNGVGSRTTETGAIASCSDKASNATNSCAVRARMLRHEDWKNLISKGPSKTTLAGPILDSVPYPGVLVAKARSYTSSDLHMVLYPSAKSGAFELGLTKLHPDTEYLCEEQPSIRFRSNNKGEASFRVDVDGRTQVTVVPRHRNR